MSEAQDSDGELGQSSVDDPKRAHIQIVDGSGIDVMLNGERLEHRDAYGKVIELEKWDFEDGPLVVNVGPSGVTARHLTDDHAEDGIEIPLEFEAEDGNTKLFLADDERYDFEVELVKIEAETDPMSGANMGVANARSLLRDFEDISVEEKHGALKHAIDELRNAKRALPEDY